jgi:hypothetical protein
MAAIAANAAYWWFAEALGNQSLYSIPRSNLIYGLLALAGLLMVIAGIVAYRKYSEWGCVSRAPKWIRIGSAWAALVSAYPLIGRLWHIGIVSQTSLGLGYEQISNELLVVLIIGCIWVWLEEEPT